MTRATSFTRTVETDPPLLTDFASEAFSGVTSVLPYLFGLLGMMMLVVGAFKLVHSAARGDGMGGAFPFLILGGGTIAFASFVLPWIFGPADTTAAPTPSTTSTTPPSPASTSTPTPVETAPATNSAPADLTGMFVALGVIAGLVLLFALVLLVTTVARRARAARAEATAQKEARDRIVQGWQRVHDHHSELLRKILHAETDWDALFFTPALSDPNVPQTYAMLRAMRDANTLRDTAGLLPRSIKADLDITKLPYARAVDEFAAAWDMAERYARKLGQKGIPAAERKTLKEIRTLLDIAENGAAAPTERTLAYRRAQSLLEGLESVHIPTKVLAQLEEQHRLMLTAQA